MTRNPTVEFSEGTAKSLSMLRGRKWSWEKLKQRLRTPEITRESYKSYLGLDPEVQANLKMRPGWFTPAVFRSTRRRKTEILYFGLIAFDCDNMSPELLDVITDPSTPHPIQYYEWALYSTRKHCAEKPRVRIVFPLAGTVQGDEYVAVVRLLAQILDPDMEAVDPVSFRPAQLMYFPSHSKDSDWVWYENDGSVVDATEFLTEHEGWRDITNLPKAAGEKVSHSAAAKAEDPWEKQNVIGDFCRAWPIESAIAEFLSDCYAPGDGHEDGNPRYTYLKGSAANGAVVYDDGRFLYSWHGTDPAGERLVNAFDLVRLHKFGDRDGDDWRKNPDPTTLPSYKAMLEWVGKDEKTMAAAAERNLRVLDLFEYVEDDECGDADPSGGAGGAGAAAGEAEPGAPEAASEGDGPRKEPRRDGPPEGWKSNMLVKPGGNGLKVCAVNMEMACTYDPRLWRRLCYDEITDRVSIKGRTKEKPRVLDGKVRVELPNPPKGQQVMPLAEQHWNALKCFFEYPMEAGGYGLEKVKKVDVEQAVMAAAHKNPVNAVRDFCEALRGRWDGVDRLGTMFARHLGEDQDEYTAAVARLYMLGVVARAFRPGHKFDQMPVIGGDQGARKSSYLKSLFGADWVRELTHGFEDQNRLVEQMLGNVVVEVAELGAKTYRELARMKEMITVGTDRTRLAYGRGARDYQRRCLFAGTTNEHTYLTDPTGNRRFWPLTCPPGWNIPMETVEKERRQIWAQAVHEYDLLAAEQGDRTLPLHLREGTEAHAIWSRRIEGVKVDSLTDDTRDVIEEWLDEPRPLSSFDGPGFPRHDEPMVVRCVVRAGELTEMLGFQRNAPGAGKLYGAVANIMQRLPGWKKSKAMYGRKSVNAYVREEATDNDRKRKWMPARNEDGSPMLYSDPDPERDDDDDRP